MFSDLVAMVIIAACKGDVKTYMVQDYPQDCQMYMVNCVVDKGLDFCLEKIGKGKTDEDKTRGTKKSD